MATNPRIPDSGSPIQRPTGGMRPEKPKSGITGTTLALIVLALLLAAIIFFMPRNPKTAPPKPGAEVPQQPAALAGAIEIQQLKMAKSPTGGSLDIQGLLNNTGTQTVNGIAMDVVFHNQNGGIADSERVKVEGLKQEGTKYVADDLQNTPLKPNDTRPFRITVDSVPQGWNQQMPELKIATVTSHP